MEQTSTQKDLLKKKLLAIKTDITKEDRSNCATEIKRSTRTINEYVNGHIYDVGIALKVLNYLQSEVKKRTILLQYN